MTEARAAYLVPLARANPLPHWYRQLQEAVELNGLALERGYGLSVNLIVRPDGTIETPKTVQIPPKRAAIDRKADKM